MTKKQTAALVEELAMEIALTVNCDQNSGRAFLYAAIKAKKDEIIREAVPYRVLAQNEAQKAAKEATQTA